MSRTYDHNRRPLQRQASAFMKLMLIFGVLGMLAGIASIASTAYLIHLLETGGKLPEPLHDTTVDQTLITTVGIAGAVLLAGGLMMTIFAKFVIWWQRT